MYGSNASFAAGLYFTGRGKKNSIVADDDGKSDAARKQNATRLMFSDRRRSARRLLLCYRVAVGKVCGGRLSIGSRVRIINQIGGEWRRKKRLVVSQCVIKLRAKRKRVWRNGERREYEIVRRRRKKSGFFRDEIGVLKGKRKNAKNTTYL